MPQENEKPLTDGAGQRPDGTRKDVDTQPNSRVSAEQGRYAVSPSYASLRREVRDA